MKRILYDCQEVSNHILHPPLTLLNDINLITLIYFMGRY